MFGAVKLTEDANKDKYGYCGYSIGFDARLQFSLPNVDCCQLLVMLNSSKFIKLDELLQTIVHQDILMIEKRYLNVQ